MEQAETLLVEKDTFSNLVYLFNESVNIGRYEQHEFTDFVDNILIQGFAIETLILANRCKEDILEQPVQDILILDKKDIFSEN